jgi:hypothetical protein
MASIGVSLRGITYEIHFAPGHYVPNEKYGIAIIAHELHHLAGARRLGLAGGGPLFGSMIYSINGALFTHDNNPLENAADNFAGKVLRDLAETSDDPRWEWP